ncbi:MAG: hypothetical protein ACYCQJ_01895 [Nitrososphaerales archaeon]
MYLAFAIILLLVASSFALFAYGKIASSPAQNNTLEPTQILVPLATKITHSLSPKPDVSIAPQLNSLATSSKWVPIGSQSISSNSSFTWGLAPFSGRVTAIAVNGSNTNEIFVGTAQGGLWKTTNGGTTWAPLTDNQSSLAVGAIALSPDNKTIYVGTGEANNCGDCYYGTGILKSTNGGASWTLLGQANFSSLAISSILVNPLNANEILVTTSSASCCGALSSVTSPSYPGIWLSTNDGASFNLFSNSISYEAGLALVPSSSTNYPIAGDFEGNVSVYTNSNQSDWSLSGTWKTLFSESSIDTSCTINSYSCRVAVASSPASPNIAYFATVNSTSSLTFIGSCNVTSACTSPNKIGIPLLTTDQTGALDAPCGNQPQAQGDYDLFLAVSPNNANNMYFGCVSSFVTTNGGSTWTPFGGYVASSLLHPDMHALTFMPGSPNTVFIGNDGGIWESTNQGTTWNNLNLGLDTLQFYHVAVSGNIILGGAQDNGCNENNGNTSWVQDQSGDGGWVGIDPSNSQIMYCVANGSPMESQDGGLTFSDASTGIVKPGSIGTAPMAQDLTNVGTFYFGAGNVIYKSSDNMTTWNVAYNKSSTTNVLSLAIAPSNSSIVYAGYDNGTVIVSNNGGSSWSILGTIPNNIPVASIVVNPTNASDIYVACSSFQTPVVVEFANGVQKNITTSGLPNLSVNVLRISQGSLLAGLDAGVYSINLGGSTWGQVGTNLPNAAVFDLAISSNGTLYAATHGRGIWANVGFASSVTTTSTTSSTTTSTTSSTTTSTTSSTATTSSTTTTSSKTTSSTTTSSQITTTTTSSSQSPPGSPSTTTTVQSSSTPTSSGGGGIPEFPFGLSITLLFTAVIVFSYVALTRSRLKLVRQRP